MTVYKNIILSAAFVMMGGLSVIASPKKKEVAPTAATNIYWHDGNGSVYYHINANPSTVARAALQMFADDMTAVMGKPAREKADAPIQIYQLDELTNKEFAALEKLAPPIHQFITHPDSYWIGTRQGKLVVVGSNGRGTAYAIMQLSRMAGISAWKDYYQVKPQHRSVLSTPAGYERLQIPAVEYRGLMLNQSEWMKSSNNSKLCRLMLRLNANMLWREEGKHHAAYNKEVTDSFDIIIGHAGKVMETSGKKHKKHKKSIDSANILWANNLPNFSCMSPGIIAAMLQQDPTLQAAQDKHKKHASHTDDQEEAWIANVDDPQAATYKLSLFMDMAWNRQAATATGIEKHLATWLKEQLGNDAGSKALPLVKEYYRLTNIRPTPYMSMPYGDWEFHSGEFGNELERYIYNYDLLKEKVLKLENSITASQQTTFRTLVSKPICIAALTAEKELEAQEARHIARPGLFSKDTEAKAAAALSLTAYHKLKQICPTAAMPSLPGTLTQKEISQYLKEAFNRKTDLKPLSASLTRTVVARNANNWSTTSAGKSDASANAVSLIPLTGHSLNAVSLPQGTTLRYTFSTDMEGDARLTLAALPYYTRITGDMRVSISIDNQEPVVISLKDTYGHTSWNMDIWRGQTRKSIYTTIGKGNHTMEIKALDQDIVLDQWILDFDLDRAYYVIPVK